LKITSLVAFLIYFTIAYFIWGKCSTLRSF